MRSGPVGVGVVGAGVISDQYLANLTTFRDVRLCFIADIDLERAATQAGRYGVPRSGTVDELLDDDEVEIVVNLTIPAVHVEIAARALAAGKHVWNEKPIALDRDSGTRLLAAATSARLRVACAPDTFLGAGIQTALRMVRSGVIGTPFGAIALYQSSGPESWHPNPEFLFQAGAGPLFDMGPYYLTALAQVLGPIARVTATASTANPMRTITGGPRAGETFPTRVPTHVSALLEFEGAGSAQCVFSFDSKLARAGFLEVTGTSGTVALPNPNRFDGDTKVWSGAHSDPFLHPPRGGGSGRGIGVVDLARAVRAGSAERASGELALHVLDVLVSIGESADRGQSVPVTSTFRPMEPLPDDWDPAILTL
ncbi:Gfo/Idh/MocA family protein [Jiangella endophytica]|uniref:Gfo/Idh/MocA family protein n=1 Tax=Jiangella endophytica TaxID=1623398 RepID=UPI000E347B2E|nr:Gfo/Idh/MocA family oxidoreductase [Jiangella endophytica]